MSDLGWAQHERREEEANAYCWTCGVDWRGDDCEDWFAWYPVKTCGGWRWLTNVTKQDTSWGFSTHSAGLNRGSDE
jgi:hypothetical protein